jgi:hypothetical protein
VLLTAVRSSIIRYVLIWHLSSLAWCLSPYPRYIRIQHTKSYELLCYLCPVIIASWIFTNAHAETLLNIKHADESFSDRTVNGQRKVSVTIMARENFYSCKEPWQILKQAIVTARFWQQTWLRQILPSKKTEHDKFLITNMVRSNFFSRVDGLDKL